MTAPSADASALARDLAVIAADSMRGREAGTPDADRAAFIIGRRLQQFGLEPYGDSMFYQRVPLVRLSVAPSTRITITKNGIAEPVTLGQDVVPMLTLGEGQPEPRRAVQAPMVFASYAITSPALHRDDLSSIDLLNKVVVIVHGAPPGVTGAARDSLNSDRELGFQLARVALRQPSAIVILMMPDAAKLYRQLYPSLVRDVRSSALPPPAFGGIQLPMILFGEARKGSRFLPPNWPDDDRSQDLDGDLSALIDVNRQSFVGYNVIARVPGTDPQLKSTYVAYSAHYDHVGVVPPVNGDSIANGADDDGSGTVALMELARLTQRQPNRRSTLFIWHTAEEKGLLGSAWFAQHPTVPIDSVVALLNVDMVGRNGSDSVYLIGPRAAPNGLSRRLGQVIDSVNASNPKPFTIDRTGDDAGHPDQLYQRSDHIHYANRGVPVAFFTTGLHADYHDVTDDASRIDYQKMARVTDLLLEIGRALGNDPRRPR